MTKKLTDINPLLLSIPEAAQKLGLSESCTRQMAYNGEIQQFEYGGGYWSQSGS